MSNTHNSERVLDAVIDALLANAQVKGADANVAVNAEPYVDTIATVAVAEQAAAIAAYVIAVNVRDSYAVPA